MASFHQPSIHRVTRVEVKQVHFICEAPAFDLVFTGPNPFGETVELRLPIFMTEGNLDYARALQAAVNALPAHEAIPYSEEEAA